MIIFRPVLANRAGIAMIFLNRDCIRANPIPAAWAAARARLNAMIANASQA
jgi:hypothetical protein